MSALQGDGIERAHGGSVAMTARWVWRFGAARCVVIPKPACTRPAQRMRVWAAETAQVARPSRGVGENEHGASAACDCADHRGGPQRPVCAAYLAAGAIKVTVIDRRVSLGGAASRGIPYPLPQFGRGVTVSPAQSESIPRSRLPKAACG